MIIDTTQTRTELDLLNLADVMEQLRQAANNDPDLVITTVHCLPFPYVDLTVEEKEWLLKNGPFLAAGESDD